MSTPSDLPAPPPPSVGAQLRMAWYEVIAEIAAGLGNAGFGDLRPVHAPILRDLLTAGLRPTELAGRLDLSKQAVNDIIREIESLGYVTLEPDPDDGRAKRIMPTERGRKLGIEAARLGGLVGERWAAQVGAERYAVFADVLREIVGEDRPPRGGTPV